MAQIDLKNIEKIEKNRNSVHDKVYTTYTVFNVGSDRYLQIDTYGKGDRENPGKISQSLQFDKETANFIVELLRREFDI